MKNFFLLSLVLVMFGLSSGCYTARQMEHGNVQVNFDRNDVDLSGQVSGEATQTRILGVDWSRLFNKKIGETGKHPFLFLPPLMGVSPYMPYPIHSMRTTNYALFELMNNNPGYDFILNPQYEITKKGFDPIYMKITVKATAQLGRYK